MTHKLCAKPLFIGLPYMPPYLLPSSVLSSFMISLFLYPHPQLLGKCILHLCAHILHPHKDALVVELALQNIASTAPQAVKHYTRYI